MTNSILDAGFTSYYTRQLLVIKDRLTYLCRLDRGGWRCGCCQWGFVHRGKCRVCRATVPNEPQSITTGDAR
jgi:hypothetical protein